MLTNPEPSLDLSAFWARFDATGAHATVLEIGGEPDIAARRTLLAVAALPRLPERPWTACDLSSVTFIDAAGVGALVAIDNDMRAQGLRLCLINPSPAVCRVFALVGLQQLLISAPDSGSSPDQATPPSDQGLLGTARPPPGWGRAAFVTPLAPARACPAVVRSRSRCAARRYSAVLHRRVRCQKLDHHSGSHLHTTFDESVVWP